MDVGDGVDAASFPLSGIVDCRLRLGSLPLGLHRSPAPGCPSVGARLGAKYDGTFSRDSGSEDTFRSGFPALLFSIS